MSSTDWSHRAADPPIARLTPREIECLRLVGSGLTSQRIGRRLGISPKTVDKHCENAARKLGSTGRVQAALRL